MFEMFADLRSLFSTLKFAELRTSALSSQLDPRAESPLFIERVEVRDLDAECALGSLRAASVELSKVTVRSPLAPDAAGPPEHLPRVTVEELRVKNATVAANAAARRAAGPARSRRQWRIEPLSAIEGTLRAAIVDAAWIFDADVTIPIGGGRVDFNRATVEHIGPDSSMGVSRMGVYVDAPNGRTYLVLLSATHVPGVRFEQRRAGLLAGWSGDRGAIELRPLLECLLSGMPVATLATGVRDMVSRTRVHGEFRLGDGVVGDERGRVVLTGRDQGKNQVALSSPPSGNGIVVRVPELSASELHWQSSGIGVSTGALSATFSVHVEVAGETPAMSLHIADLTLHKLGVMASAQT